MTRREPALRFPSAAAVSRAELDRLIAAAAKAGAEAAVRAHRERQARARFLELVDEHDATLPPAVRAAAWVGVRSAVDDAWVRLQLEKRAAHFRHLAEALDLDSDDAERILTTRAVGLLSIEGSTR